MGSDAVFISAREASQRPAVFLDCRFRLTDPQWGHARYLEAHLPSARYAHLDHDLADLENGRGRHPLPTLARFAEKLRIWGITTDTRVVVYDDVGGAMAARAWWLLRWAGVRAVFILDGGLQAWTAEGLPTVSQQPEGSAADGLPAAGGAMPVVDQAELSQILADSNRLLLDARSEARYRGIEEPIDAVAGHIPGGINWPYENNLHQQRLRPVSELREAWNRLLDHHEPSSVVHMCGSGVTACFNLACMEHLGLTGSSLYVASWSGWITDPDNPVATGA